MKHRPALYALIRLHGELQGRIKEHRTAAMRARSDMRHIEHVIKLLEPDFNIAAIAARRKFAINPVFRRKKLFYAVAAVLKEAAGPLTSQEIAALLIAKHYSNSLTARQKHDFDSAVTKGLKRYPHYFSGDGCRPQRWTITDKPAQ